MRLRIVTPVRPVVDAEVTEIVAPGVEGEFGVLAQHVTLLAGLKPGVVTWTEGGAKKRVVVSGGYAEIRQDSIALLADDAEFPEEVEAAQARAQIAAAQDELSRGSDDPATTERLLRELALAEARASVAAR